MIPDITELRLPPYMTICQATCSFVDMGDSTISTQFRMPNNIEVDFSYDWILRFRGVNFIMPLHESRGLQTNTSLQTETELTFTHWAQYQLSRWFFFTVQPVESGTAIPDKYIASVNLNLGDFCNLFKQVLEYYYGDQITLVLNPEWKYDHEPTAIEIDHSYCWDILLKLYELFKVRWSIEPVDTDTDKYVIRVGYYTEPVDHIFRLSQEGGLVSFEKQISDENIRNIILGRGTDKNLPIRYFKDLDPENDSFPADPDWIPELRDIYFSGLRGATFRSYIQGWNHRHYQRTSVTRAEEAYAPWAWMRGFTDDKFNPVEFVADGFSTQKGGYEILPDSSIARYGELMDGLSDDEDHYPTIQNIRSGDHLNFFKQDFGRVDEVVFVSDVTDDNKQETSNDAIAQTISYQTGQISINSGQRVALELSAQSFQSGIISIPADKYGDIDPGTVSLYSSSGNISDVVIESVNVVVKSRSTQNTFPATGIPEGEYQVNIVVNLHNTGTETLHITAICNNIVLITATPDESADTFYVLVKNLWGTSRNADETDTQYAQRVWLPILGNANGDEAKIIFSDGALALSKDYEFRIIGTPEHVEQTCEWETMSDGKPVLHSYTSHWRICLQRCDADLDTLGEMIPNSRRYASPGDHFFFTGIELPHPYVIWAEEDLDNCKKLILEQKKDAQPTYLASFSKVRVGSLHPDDKLLLLDALKPGNSLILENEQLIGGSHQEIVHIQNVTFTYSEVSADNPVFVPDIDVTLGTDYDVSANPVSTLQGEVSALQRQVGSLSNLSQAVRQTGDKIYLSKTRADRTPYPLNIGGRLTAENGVQFGQSFASGLTGFGGRIDSEGNGELESLFLRRWLEVPELRYNRVSLGSSVVWHTPGGGIVLDAQTSLNTGIVKLKLEEGELPRVAPGDICLGIFHNRHADLNSSVDSDDGKGNFRFSGFSTIYFRIDSVDGDSFSYTLRPGYNVHPQEGMHFACYGSFSDKSRRSSYYQTTSYLRFIRDVDDWEFTEQMIAMQLGDLSGLSVQGIDMQGIGLYADTLYYRQNLSHVDIKFSELRVDAVDSYGTVMGTIPTSLMPGQTIYLRFGVWFQGEVMKDGVVWSSLERSSGNDESDAGWVSNHDLSIDDDGFAWLELNSSDLGDNFTTLFTVRAIFERDRNGYPVIQNLARSILLERPESIYIDRGAWQSGIKYLCGQVNADGRLETSDVWHRGQKWRCLVSHESDSLSEPGFGIIQWQWIEGDPEPKASFTETDQLFKLTDIEIPLSLRVLWHGQDITDFIDDSDVRWSRYSTDSFNNERTTLDSQWNTQNANRGKSVVFTEADCQTEAGGYSLGIGRLVFSAEVTIRNPHTNTTMRTLRMTKEF